MKTYLRETQVKRSLHNKMVSVREKTVNENVSPISVVQKTFSDTSQNRDRKNVKPFSQQMS
jgi:hypothetical protein